VVQAAATPAAHLYAHAQQVAAAASVLLRGAALRACSLHPYHCYVASFSLRRMPWLQVVPRAKVPIAKLVIMPFGLKFDISIGKRNGLDAVALIRQHLRDWPPLRPLVTILKLYLQQREMNEVRQLSKSYHRWNWGFLVVDRNHACKLHAAESRQDSAAELYALDCSYAHPMLMPSSVRIVECK
jgi:hypothetical protein